MKKLTIIYALSAAGKTTIQKEIESIPNTESVISCTTRDQRPGEINGKDYFFIKPVDFNEADMAAYIQIGSNKNWKYGVQIEELNRIQGNGVFSIISADYVLDLKKAAELLGIEVEVVFIHTPRDVRYKRLLLRGESKESIEARFDFEDKYSLKDIKKLFPGIIIINGNQKPQKVLQDFLEATTKGD